MSRLRRIGQPAGALGMLLLGIGLEDFPRLLVWCGAAVCGVLWLLSIGPIHDRTLEFRQRRPSLSLAVFVICGCILGGLLGGAVWLLHKPAGVAQSDKAWPANLSDQQLADSGIDLAQRLRRFVADSRYQSIQDITQATQGRPARRMTDKEMEEEQQNDVKRYQRQTQLLVDTYNQTFKADALALRHEILNRLPRTERYDPDTVAHESRYQAASMGNMFLMEQVADDLEILSKKLKSMPH